MPEPENDERIRALLLQLLDMLDRLRDGINLQIECTMRDIRREMKNKEEQR